MTDEQGTTDTFDFFLEFIAPEIEEEEEESTPVDQ